MFSRNPQKLEEKALAYETQGKTAKAQKYRQKAAKFGGAGNQQILGQNQLVQQPLMGQQLGGQSLLGGQQLGGQSLLGGQQLGGQQFLSGQQLGGHQLPNMGQQQFQQPNMGQQQFQQPILGQQQLGGQSLLGGQQLGGQSLLGGQQLGGWAPTRTPAMYENNAMKWEKRGNYTKAQKNRGKVWRLQNPQLAQVAPPQLYNNREFLGYNVPAPMPQQMVQQTQVEHIVRPTIVEETMRPERIVEVQPIIHRDIEAPQLNIVERHTYETVPTAGPSTFTNAPIVQETVRPRIIEEVQPVVHREVPAPFIEKVEQHVTEHIVNPTITTKEVQNQRAAPFIAAGGPTMTQTTTTSTTQGSRLL